MVIALKWRKLEGATYNVYRSPDNVNFLIIAEGLTDNSFTDTIPFKGANYYKVKSIIDGCESVYSEIVEATSTVKYETFNVNGVSFKMIKVEGGIYKMGSNDGDSNEKPVHDEIIKTFQIGETEVTQGLWYAVMGSNPSYFKGNDNLPVNGVSWNDCQTFINRLNEMTGQQFRLPTEAEWEYAARGGNKSQGYVYSGSNHLSDVAWYQTNSGNKTHPVAELEPNELGIFDMSGNITEWTSDWYSTDYSSVRHRDHRVSRGGNYGAGASWCRIAARSHHYPDFPTNHGLRLAL